MYLHLIIFFMWLILTWHLYAKSTGQIIILKYVPYCLFNDINTGKISANLKKAIDANNTNFNLQVSQKFSQKLIHKGNYILPVMKSRIDFSSLF